MSDQNSTLWIMSSVMVSPSNLTIPDRMVALSSKFIFADTDKGYKKFKKLTFWPFQKQRAFVLSIPTQHYPYCADPNSSSIGCAVISRQFPIEWYTHLLGKVAMRRRQPTPIEPRWTQSDAQKERNPPNPVISDPTCPGNSLGDW